MELVVDRGVQPVSSYGFERGNILGFQHEQN